MRSIRYLGGLAMTCAAINTNASDNPLGFYVGAAAGRSNIRVNDPSSGLELDARPGGWTVFAGLRPLSLLGAELQYIEYGHSTVQPTLSGLSATAQRVGTVDWKQHATTLSALIYAPIPLPFFDVYGKAGLAQLDTRGIASQGCGSITVCSPYSPNVTPINKTATHFSYGAGSQLKVSSLAFRLEYQESGARGRGPDLLSFGVSWEF
jgi:Outer membrane protein beta-barrel domain